MYIFELGAFNIFERIIFDEIKFKASILDFIIISIIDLFIYHENLIVRKYLLVLKC